MEDVLIPPRVGLPLPHDLVEAFSKYLFKEYLVTLGVPSLGNATALEFFWVWYVVGFTFEISKFVSMDGWHGSVGL